MNTQEAIEIVEGIKNGNVPSSYSEFCKGYNHKLNRVIECLQHGEALKEENVELKAYKLIVEELRNKPTYLTHGMLPLWLKELEQKYFPK